MSATDFYQFLTAFKDKMLRNTMIGCIARIESHDESTMRADIVPLLLFSSDGKTEADTAMGVIPSVPVLFLHAGGFYIRPKYLKDDIVWVSFATHDITKGLSGDTDRTDGRIFSSENACVVSGIAKTDWSAPDGFTGEGIIIGHEDGKMILTLSKDEIKAAATKFTFEGDLTVKGDITTTGEVTWNSESAATKASTHIHGTGVGPSSAPQAGS